MKTNTYLFIVLAAIIFLSSVLNANGENRTFLIDYENNQFLKDGQPFRYVSGDLAYFKIPAALWKDRLTKLRLAGLNAIQTYIAWNLHESERGEYSFTGDLDFVNFFELAQELGFVAIVRPGPFVNGELDMGGLPYWLLSINQTMALRTSDAQYMAEVERWLSVLMPKLKPLIYQNGGPIITVQVENEYGAHPNCDPTYPIVLRDLFKGYLGSEVVLFTTG